MLHPAPLVAALVAPLVAALVAVAAFAAPYPALSAALDSFSSDDLPAYPYKPSRSSSLEEPCQ